MSRRSGSSRGKSHTPCWRASQVAPHTHHEARDCRRCHSYCIAIADLCMGLFSDFVCDCVRCRRYHHHHHHHRRSNRPADTCTYSRCPSETWRRRTLTPFSRRRAAPATCPGSRHCSAAHGISRTRTSAVSGACPCPAARRRHWSCSQHRIRRPSRPYRRRCWHRCPGLSRCWAPCTSTRAGPLCSPWRSLDAARSWARPYAL